jgi:COP9 signalosome complex subunit 5
MHARSGGTLEVMGMLLGKIDGENMIVMDSFALPVEGTGKIFIKQNLFNNRD